MTKFKVGDRVRILRNRGPGSQNAEELPLTEGLQLGDIVTVTEFEALSKTMGYDRLYVDKGWQWMRSDDVELVEDTPMPTPEYSCIRVVPPSKPKREIIKGVHRFPSNSNAEYEIGKVDEFHSGLCVDIVLATGYLKASEIREFATILNEIASVLEENSNA